ncbi:MAG: hypothetical protein NC341_05845 [Blautia sp.]|nr:hypothetical protein [Blautia sp.]
MSIKKYRPPASLILPMALRQLFEKVFFKQNMQRRRINSASFVVFSEKGCSGILFLNFWFVEIYGILYEKQWIRL